MTAIVVAGRTGSGKTTLANAICSHSAFGYANVGEILASELTRRRIPTRSKADVGPRFMDKFGLSRYLELVADVALRGDVVIDGLRVAAGLQVVRESTQTIVAFREHHSAAELDEPYVADLDLLRREADIVVPWYADPAEVAVVADRVLRLATA